MENMLLTRTTSRDNIVLAKQLNQYKRDKIKFLTQFCCYISKEQLCRLKELQTEIAVDNWCKSVIKKYLFSLK